MPLLTWVRKVLGGSPPPTTRPSLQLLHRWQGGYARCIECGSAAYDDPLHLHPSSRVIEIHDVTEAWARQPYGETHPGSLLSLASSVFYVDEAARVYMAEGWPGMVFVELSDKTKQAMVNHFSERYRPMGVLMVYVGCK